MLGLKFHAVLMGWSFVIFFDRKVISIYIRHDSLEVNYDPKIPLLEC